MAGSLRHIVDTDGCFTMELIENLGDAYEALEECFNLILAMTGGEKKEINPYLECLNYLELDVNMINHEDQKCQA